MLGQSLFPIVYTVRDLSPHSWRHIAFPGTQLAGLIKKIQILHSFLLLFSFFPILYKNDLKALLVLDQEYF